MANGSRERIRLNDPEEIESAEDDSFGPSQPLSNARWERFAQLYAVRGTTITQAAIDAGYGNGNRSSASVTGSRLLNNVTISNRIVEILREDNRELGLTRQWITKLDMLAASSDIGNYIEISGSRTAFKLKDINAMTFEERYPLEGMKSGRRGTEETFEIKVQSKAVARQRLHLTLDRQEDQPPVGDDLNADLRAELDDMDYMVPIEEELTPEELQLLNGDEEDD